MKKPFRHTELSDRRCIDCERRLKKNLISRKPTAKRCYKCYRIRRFKHQHKKGGDHVKGGVPTTV